MKSSCWYWLGSKSKGYGKIVFRLGSKQKAYRAHRHFFEMAYGPIPNGKELHHRCRNPACVNPRHMQIVTHAENMAYEKKAYCKRGHKLALAYVRPNNSRQCRACKRLAASGNI